MIESLRIVITRIFAVALIAMILVSSSALKSSWPLLGSFLAFIGIALVAVAVLGRMWCSLYIAGYKTDTLIDKGPYSMCRNPLYLFSLSGAVGIGLVTQTFTIPAIILIAFGAYYPQVIKSEEARLMELHGDAFKRYLDTVPRFFPALSRLTEPVEYAVKPKIFRRHMTDVIWFILIVGFLQIIDGLRMSNILPVLIQLY